MAAPSPWSWAGFYEGIILLGSVWRQGWDEEWWGIKIGSADFIKDGTAARLLRHDFNPATLCQPPPFRPPTLNSQTKSKHIAQERTLGKKDKNDKTNKKFHIFELTCPLMTNIDTTLQTPNPQQSNQVNRTKSREKRKCNEMQNCTLTCVQALHKSKAIASIISKGHCCLGSSRIFFKFRQL